MRIYPAQKLAQGVCQEISWKEAMEIVGWEPKAMRYKGVALSHEGKGLVLGIAEYREMPEGYTVIFTTE